MTITTTHRKQWRRKAKDILSDLDISTQGEVDQARRVLVLLDELEKSQSAIQRLRDGLARGTSSCIDVADVEYLLDPTA